MSENENKLDINNIQYNVKSVYAKSAAETLDTKIKRLILTEKIVQLKIENNKSHI